MSKTPTAGERLRQVLKKANLDPATASKLAGYPFRSGLQFQLGSKQPYFHPKVIEKLTKLVGRGNPAISEAQIQALGVPEKLSTTLQSYPEGASLAPQPEPVPRSSMPVGVAGDSTGSRRMEADLIRGLIEDVAILKSEIRAMKSKMARQGNSGTDTPPTRARSGRS